MADSASDSATISISSPVVKGLTQGVAQGTPTTTTSIVTFTPTGRPTGLSQEVFGTVGIHENTRGAVEDLGGVRVQHVHDRHLYRLSEDLVVTSQSIAELLAESRPTPAGENHVGQISGHSTVIRVALAVDTAAYATGDLIGSKLALPGAARIAGGTGLIHSITLVDQANQKLAIDVLFFASDPSATPFTDNAALDVADNDLLKAVGLVSIAASDYVSFADNALATVRGINLPFQLDNGTTLYAALIARSAPTYAATSDVQLKVGILQD